MLCDTAVKLKAQLKCFVGQNVSFQVWSLWRSHGHGQCPSTAAALELEASMLFVPQILLSSLQTLNKLQINTKKWWRSGWYWHPIAWKFIAYWSNNYWFRKLASKLPLGENVDTNGCLALYIRLATCPAWKRKIILLLIASWNESTV